MDSLDELGEQILDFEKKLLSLIRFFYNLPDEERRRYFDYIFLNSLEYGRIRENALFHEFYSEFELYTQIGLSCDLEIEKWRLFDQLKDDRPQIVV